MLRVSFSSMTTARAAVNVLEAFGYSTKQFGRDVVTNCPTLLAVPAIEKRIGFADIDRLDVSGGSDAIEWTAEFRAEATPGRAARSSEATA
jgi:hypothetical protein